MRLSKRSEYGVRAMLLLSSHVGEEAALSIRSIADTEAIPIKFLEQILLMLKNAGLLNSRKGAGGGYYLARTPQEINLASIIRVLDGPLAPVKCVSQMAYEPCECADENTCGLRMVMQDVREAIVTILEKTTLTDLADRVKHQRTISDISWDGEI